MGKRDSDFLTKYFRAIAAEDGGSYAGHSLENGLENHSLHVPDDAARDRIIRRLASLCRPPYFEMRPDDNDVLIFSTRSPANAAKGVRFLDPEGVEAIKKTIKDRGTQPKLG